MFDLYLLLLVRVHHCNHLIMLFLPRGHFNLDGLVWLGHGCLLNHRLLHHMRGGYLRLLHLLHVIDHLHLNLLLLPSCVMMLLHELLLLMGLHSLQLHLLRLHQAPVLLLRHNLLL